jgi:hypothetical protein
MRRYAKFGLVGLALGVLLCVYTARAGVYGSTGVQTVTPGSIVTLWSAETPTPGVGTTAASIQIAPSPSTTKSGTPLAVDGKFSAAPGAFEVDVQVAATDSDTNYQTCSNCAITTVDATNQTFHLDFNGTTRFLRLLLRTRTNSVSITATATGG